MSVHPSDPPTLTFRGGWLIAFVPLAVFIATCFAYFVVFKAFDMNALTAGAFVGLLVGALLAKDYTGFWNAVLRGMSSPTSATIVLILFVIGIYSQLIKVSGLSSGFVWIAENLNVGSGAFTLFTFVAVCVVSMSTGSSIGTMFTAFPIFFAAGVALGAPAPVLAGAIVSGAIFGDNLAPVSDTTIISASTQRFRFKPGTADIGGVVKSRMPYALVAAGISAVFFTIFGAIGSTSGDTPDMLAEIANPASLWMLIPVGLMLVIATVKRDIFLAITVGLLTGFATALIAGLIHLTDVVSVTDGVPSGFLVDGVAGIIGTVGLVLAVFGIMGVLVSAGVLERITAALLHGRLGRTPRGAEIAIGLGITAFTVAFGGVNSASMVTFGPVADELGARVGLHPYRRANVMDSFAMGISCVVPVLSAFLFIGSSLAGGYDIAPPTTTDLFVYTFYPLALTVVMAFAVATGWGRRFEAADGSAARKPLPPTEFPAAFETPVLHA